MENKLTNFILTGRVENLFVGQSVDKSKGEWIDSVEQHANGIPKLHKCFLDELVMNIGVTSENKIEYIVIHIGDLEQSNEVRIGNLSNSVNSVTIDELIAFLNTANINWRFKSVWEKVIILLIEESNVEIIFSYYAEEGVGLQIVQVNGNLK